LNFLTICKNIFKYLLYNKMKTKEFFKNFNILSKKYLIFVFLIILAIAIVHNILVYVSYRSHKDSLEKKYLSYAILAGNSYEIFLDNVFHQAEFYGKKINNNYNEEAINELLKNNFSFNTNLDTLRLINWIKFDFISSKNPKFYDNNLAFLSKNEPWKIHFDAIELSSNKTYLPLSFGIVNKYQKFVGTLYSRIDITSLISFLQKNFKEENITIAIIDNNKNIIAQTPEKIDVPIKFFNDINLENQSGNINKEYEPNNKIFIAYKKLESYPFTIIVAENKNIIFEPVKNNINRYFFGLFFAIVSISIILLAFYQILISPIIHLFNLANNILNSDEKIIYNPSKKHHFNEIKKLEQALLKINDYKIELKDTNNQLINKTDELEKLTQSLELENSKLSRAYELKDEMQKKSSTSINFNPHEIIQECLEMIYPEIYSRQIIIENEIKEMPKINIPQNIFTQIIINLLSRSFIFCKKNDKIILNNNYTEIDEIDYVSIIIEDCGVGDESFRKKILQNSCTAEETIRLIQAHSGFFKFIDQENGVKYCMLLPAQSNNKHKENSKIINMFPDKNK
jgi:hypothetical protein